jgi:DNA invertase Pin-like site-specific DNA recombinase
MKAVAYCRVSTNKDEQLDSLDAQQRFFTEYAVRNQFNLVKIYADEGKSGTKIKNRSQLLKLLADANRGLFETVLIKDVSRLARNTVDFLTSIRKLKTLNVKVVFVNYDQTSSDSSEFMLTMLSAIAQEESSNTSKRVKFGKKINAEKGRVPNFIYGYDKIPGDYFNLSMNEAEAALVRRIFDMYVQQQIGANKIALTLNTEGLRTKRGSNWSQNAISRILTNPIYIGKIINGKQEVEDFLTGKRKVIEAENWLITERMDLAIIDDVTFSKAAKILDGRKDVFKITGERNSEKHIFSKLIKCKCCGASFRRTVRTYQNTYVKWVCTGRNSNGVDACLNKTVIDEDELLAAIRDYFAQLLRDKPNVIDRIISEFNRLYKKKDENQLSEKELSSQLSKLRKTKDKYMEMYTADVITLDELREKSAELNDSIDKLTEELRLVNSNITKSDLLGGIMIETFKDIDTLVSTGLVTHAALSRVLEKIEVDEHHNVDIYLKLLSEIGLEDTVHLTDVYS